MSSHARGDPNYSDWHSLMKFNLASLLFIKQIRTDAQREIYLYRCLNSSGLHGNTLVGRSEHYHLKLLNICSKTMSAYYTQNETGFKCSSCQPERYHKCKLFKSPADTLRVRFICLLMKKRPMPICTVHLFPVITHRQFRKLTQQSPLSFTEPLHSLAGKSRAVFVSQLLDGTKSCFIYPVDPVQMSSSFLTTRNSQIGTQEMQTSGNVRSVLKVITTANIPVYTCPTVS